MAFTVRVIGIFTRNARSSATVQQRRARLASDIAFANEAWGTGFFPGVICGMNFVSGGTWNFTGTTIPASTVSSIDTSSVNTLIRNVRSQTGDATAIYVVYLSGDFLSNGRSIGNAGPRFKFNSNRRLVGHCVLTDLSGNVNNRYAFAHEAGHVLFGRFNSAGQITIDDPSNPGNIHNNNSQNLMFSTAPRSNPFITAQQCIVARRSSVVLENAIGNNRRKKQFPILGRRKQCCKPISSPNRTLRKIVTRKRK
jgi:hypothetical protein